jgi:hypothetical protein
MTRTKVIAWMTSWALTAAAALMIMSAAFSADAPSPFIGKWALDLEKSTFQPGPSGMKSQTVTVTAAPGGATTSHTVIDTVLADGSTNRTEYTSANDGKAVPVTGDPDDDAVVATLLSPNTVKDVYMKAGKASGTGTFTVSKNGKIMQGTLSGTAPDGTKWKNHFVYVRQ